MIEENEIGLLDWYALSRNGNGWVIMRLTKSGAMWMRRFCEIEGPFPIRDIARLAVGYQLSRHHRLATLHGHDLMFCLIEYGMDKWSAFHLMRVLDERAGHERAALPS